MAPRRRIDPLVQCIWAGHRPAIRARPHRREVSRRRMMSESVLSRRISLRRRTCPAPSDETRGDAPCASAAVRASRASGIAPRDTAVHRWKSRRPGSPGAASAGVDRNEHPARKMPITAAFACMTCVPWWRRGLEPEDLEVRARTTSEALAPRHGGRRKLTPKFRQASRGPCHEEDLCFSSRRCSLRQPSSKSRS